ncbi:Flavanone 7-O-glucoside 2''-O-beta-L-rhamnosyltransferase [Vitis vinifera]|uniref:Flavanone 7-O-glucoside 2''-O-beta-L-rhamnosyltransferase n=1 Tax=Vitis vinifera TaxID=29760 RepID=A0A438HQU1_VITVI|nr:Flavanone 7-O-glucoside 2''-O-beta-L-rhamnosyltransferase [Vitis vinifera]
MDMDMDMRNGGTISVVMLPWLAHGHISPFLELAKKLSRRNFYIYFCSTPVNLGCIKAMGSNCSFSLNIPAILFFSTGAAVLSIILHLELNRVTGSGANNMKDEERAAECLKLSSNVILIKTFREMEGKYIDYISALSEKKLIPVGPLVADSTEEFENAAIIDWLNKKDKLSAVLVSFGSEYFMSKEEMEEIAHG